MITEVLNPSPDTIVFCALHYAYHHRYIGMTSVLAAFSSFYEDMSAEEYNVFYTAWAKRHEFTPRPGYL